jgi:hypothetical protein
MIDDVTLQIATLVGSAIWLLRKRLRARTDQGA